MKVPAAVLGIALLLTATSVAQQSAWTTGSRDCFLIAPNATDVKEPMGPGRELTYIVEVPYPAKEFLGHIVDVLSRNHWDPLPDYPGDPNAPPGVNLWEKYGGGRGDKPTGPRPEYSWRVTWENDNHERVTYALQYTNSRKEHYLKTLHVVVNYTPAKYGYHKTGTPPPPRKSELLSKMSSIFSDVSSWMGEWGWLTVYCLALVLPPLYVFRTAGSQVFYKGPGEILTSANLVCFGVAALPLGALGVAVILIPLWIIAPPAAILMLVAPFLLIAVMSIFGYVACIVVPVLVVGILLDKRIPRVVSRAHCALGFGTLAVSVLFAYHWSTHPHTLFQW